ncbi:iron chelate uptake ABC transporter family permease subunit [Cellulomonas sp. HZM]|uniref:FecCD family ABC transporter permease n=1 Tax=Cellulomonas sp. HZM TaxID=1454010 RepID=UPI0004931911|nr:iron chelate uptake ABC transporter family permease subunit [Cellulomonas sp. HZM]
MSAVLDRPAAAARPGAVVAAGRRSRVRRWRLVVAVLAVVLLAAVVVTLCVGERSYSIADVVRVVLGQHVQGASYTVGQLRLPRVVAGVLVGIAFGMGGVVFQTMLRNALASPDIIGISAGASAAAVLSITAFGLSGLVLSGVAVVAGIGVALAIYALSWRGGVHGTRLILIGIAVGAMLDSVVSYALTRSEVYQVNEALRWLTGSLNSAFWPVVGPLAAAMVVLVPCAWLLARRLTALQLGDDASTALGVPADRTRLQLLVVAVALVSVGTAAAGPIAFVAFLSGPIAHRLVRGSGPLLWPSALVGALLVVVGDFAGQHLLGTRFPVGVVTGVLGAPYLLWLLARANRSGASL